MLAQLIEFATNHYVLSGLFVALLVALLALAVIIGFYLWGGRP